jgi:hypothetical protein
MPPGKTSVASARLRPKTSFSVRAHSATLARCIQLQAGRLALQNSLAGDVIPAGESYRVTRATRDKLAGGPARRMQQPVPFVLAVTPTAVMFMVVVPVTSRSAAFMVMAPITSRPAAIVTRVMPLPFTPMALFPLPTLPITMPVIVPVTVPARSDDNNTWRFGIHRWGRSVDRLGRIHSTGDANVYSNIDVC